MVKTLINRFRHFKVPPNIRVSLALAVYAASILLISSLFGLFPDKQQTELEKRLDLSKSLVITLSLLLANNQLRLSETTLNEFININQAAIAGFIKTEAGLILIQVGNIEHLQSDANQVDHSPTITHIKIPIFKKNALWATFHVEFNPLYRDGWVGWFVNSIYGLALIVGVCCFVGYLLMLSRMLRELNPQDVIPARVQSAFNTLTEALVIIDDNKYILLANDAFGAKVNRPADALLGLEIASFNWVFRQETPVVYPWESTLSDGSTATGVRMRLDAGNKQHKILLSTNCSPIKDDNGKVRGALITFEDVSELEEQNTQLSKLITRLRETETEIRKKNMALSKLAKYDPLTNCYNRRTLFDTFHYLFQQSRQAGTDLSCLMIDIDHFKSVNDNHGHSVGDQVIKFVVGIIQEKTRDTDIVGRYGGEEFCIVLPGFSNEEARNVAERIRVTIQHKSTKELTLVGRITTSIGICLLNSKISSPTEMVDLADKALYQAKNSGRNRVVVWDPAMRVIDNTAEKMGDKNDQDSHLANVSHPVSNGVSQSDHSQSKIIKSLSQQVEVLGKEAAEKEQALQQHLHIDEISGLPTQLAFIDELNRAIKLHKLHQKPGVVMVIKLKTSSEISETLGADAGNLLIRKLGERLLTIMKKPVVRRLMVDCKYTMARLDSDQFGILLSVLNNVEVVADIAHHIFTGVTSPVDVDGIQLHCTPEIGISSYPKNTLNAEELIRKATIAKRYAKDNNNSQKIEFYHDLMDDEAYKLVRLESELQLALKRDQLELYYQPCIDIKSGCIVSAEALLRWEHQEFGKIPATTIIDIAERIGLIQEISEWIFTVVCWQLQYWQKSGTTPVRIFINLSALDIQNKNKPAIFSSIIEKSGISTEYLGVEVTETALINDLEVSAKVLNSLSALGLKIALDDFGTGYSSLSYLQNLNLDILKIDRVFLKTILSDARSIKLYAAIISMAQAMEIIAVAEGIESKEEMDVVSELGVDRMQGYYFCSPKPAHLLSQSLGKMSTVP
ncbi:MAG: diguanylate cyclase (GGDEF)-like protein [Cellvibrionaceae bacterium]|jgi:diguanylate cyclase (GGDEF)-like protein